MKICIACGMPMENASDFPGGDMEKDYCIHCARPDGFIMKTQGFDESAAIESALNGMKKLPAWKHFF